MNLRWKIAQFAEFYWWKKYLKKKDKAEYLDWKKNYWSRFIERLDLGAINDKRVLDLGCGPAGIFTILSSAKEVTGVDPLIDSYSKLDHFNPSEYPWVRFESTSLERFETTQRFDVIFCLNVINHIGNIESGMERIMDLLSENGVLILSSDIHRYNILKGIFRTIPGDILHPQQHDFVDYLRLIRRNRGEVVRNFRLKRESIFDYQVFVINKQKYGQAIS